MYVKWVPMPAHDHSEHLLKGDDYIVGHSDNLQDAGFDASLTNRQGMPDKSASKKIPVADKFKGIPVHPSKVGLHTKAQDVMMDVLVAGDSTTLLYRPNPGGKKGNKSKKCTPAQILKELTWWNNIESMFRGKPNNTSSTRCTVEAGATAYSTLMNLFYVYRSRVEQD